METRTGQTGQWIAGQNGLRAAPALLVLLVLWAVAASLPPASKDYISYWSAGQLLTRHSNPYDNRSVLALEKSAGYQLPRPLVMRNPPWSLFSVLPLGSMDAHPGLVLWLSASLALLALFFLQSRMPYQDGLLLCCFPAVLLCMITGQSSALLLFGLVGFLAWEDRKPMLAGASLLLLAFKPHAVFLFWPVLMADCWYRRRFRLLAGTVAAFMAATAVALRFDPFVWRHYWAMLHAEQIGNSYVPTPSFWLWRLLAPRFQWVELAPTACALLWAAWYYRRNRRVWDWPVHSMPLLFVSLLCSPYSWMTDEIILLPSLALTLRHADCGRYSRHILGLLSLLIFGLILTGRPLTSGAYVWSSAAWLGWYVYSLGWKALSAPQDCIRPRGLVSHPSMDAAMHSPANPGPPMDTTIRRAADASKLSGDRAF